MADIFLKYGGKDYKVLTPFFKKDSKTYKDKVYYIEERKLRNGRLYFNKRTRGLEF